MLRGILLTNKSMLISLLGNIHLPKCSFSITYHYYMHIPRHGNHTFFRSFYSHLQDMCAGTHVNKSCPADTKIGDTH